MVPSDILGILDKMLIHQRSSLKFLCRKQENNLDQTLSRCKALNFMK